MILRLLSLFGRLYVCTTDDNDLTDFKLLIVTGFVWIVQDQHDVKCNNINNKNGLILLIF